LLVGFGLGNPGARYVGTRHNLGKEVVTCLVEELRLKVNPGRGPYSYAHDPSRDLSLVIPTIYVNTSGVAARDVVEHLGITLEEFLVVCDDFNIPLGTLRIRKKGSDGGHNGLASIIYQLSSQDFPRLRLGVGPVPPGMEAADFVLSGFEPDEEATVRALKSTACEALLAVAAGGIDDTMNTYNRRVGP
jgi:PTH1 family peptidyl-tRNA hydrolase